jgi:hypothetical protein
MGMSCLGFFSSAKSALSPVRAGEQIAKETGRRAAPVGIFCRAAALRAFGSLHSGIGGLCNRASTSGAPFVWIFAPQTLQNGLPGKSGAPQLPQNVPTDIPPKSVFG